MTVGVKPRFGSLRVQLHEQDHHCFWCGEPTILVGPAHGQPFEPRMATLDHFRNRLDPLRDKIPDEPQHVLACYECNHERGYQEEQAYLHHRIGMAQWRARNEGEYDSGVGSWLEYERRQREVAPMRASIFEIMETQKQHG